MTIQDRITLKETENTEMNKFLNNTKILGVQQPTKEHQENFFSALRLIRCSSVFKLNL